MDVVFSIFRLHRIFSASLLLHTIQFLKKCDDVKPFSSFLQSYFYRSTMICLFHLSLHIILFFLSVTVRVCRFPAWDSKSEDRIKTFSDLYFWINFQNEIVGNQIICTKQFQNNQGKSVFFPRFKILSGSYISKKLLLQ